MSKFIDKLNQLTQSEPQSMGFRPRQPASTKPKIQLVATLDEEDAESLAQHLVGADAGLLRVSKLSSGRETLSKVRQAVPDILWGCQLPGSELSEIKELSETGCDFIVFRAAAPLATLPDEAVGKILEVEASLGEGLLRATNELPIDAVLVAREPEDFLTWQHLMLFRRFATLITMPLLVSIPPAIKANELQALWDAGVNGVMVEVKAEQPQDRIKELRQVIDKLALPSPQRRKKLEPILPHPNREPEVVTTEEEEEEE